MKKLIAIDPGHGMNTPGKRTPTFPDGSFMKEREFNKAVALDLIAMLKRRNFDVINVAESDTDVPLSTRTALANNRIKNACSRPADLYLSIHANAYGSGTVFNEANGIETFIHNSVKSGSTMERWGRIIHKRLVAVADLHNRGVKRADFQVLRETAMPAILVECGFMTNLNEARLLKSINYRNDVAIGLLIGICEIFDVDCEITENDFNTDKPKSKDKEPPVVPEWQTAAFKKLTDSGLIRSPDYWEGRLHEQPTIGEMMGIIANI